MNLALVPLDGSELSDSILGHLERLLGHDPWELHLLRVLPTPAAGADPSVVARERSVAELHLASVRQRLEARGARVATELREGDPAGEILAAAEERRPALVAMSSHGRTGVLRWVRGSVAERVLRNCATPLLLATPRAGGAAPELRYRRILVPLDGSEGSASVLPWVEALARAHQAEVVLLRVEWEGLNRPLLAAALAPERVLESLGPWVERLAAHGSKVRALAAQGDHAREILEVAEREEVDLVAMATHARTGLSRFVDGSVSEKVLRHCTRPLLVAPRG